MSYQQPPAGTPPQAAPGALPPAAPDPALMPPPPAAPVGAPVLRKDTRTLVAAVLGLTAVVLLLVSVLGHTWLRPESLPDEMSGGYGLWSMSVEGDGTTVEMPLTDMLVGPDDESKVKAGMFAYGSMIFFVLNWLVIVVLAIGSLTGFLRFAAGRSAGVPFALTLIPTIVAVVAFLAWFGVSVLLSEALDSTDLGGMVFLWWGGILAAFVAAVLYAKVRSQAAFGAGFRGTGGMMPPGGGVVGGPQVLPPGSGSIGNPADSLGGPR
ncbi:MAG: hypothetical protein JXB32_25170 [Deltaproteobacteria bacterium]|nr:hypothetical protein [Deltaproteobacteria bacterium]